MTMTEHEPRSAQPSVLAAIEQHISTRETAEILADPDALRGLNEGRESELTGDITYGVDAVRALLAKRRR